MGCGDATACKARAKTAKEAFKDTIVQVKMPKILKMLKMLR